METLGNKTLLNSAPKFYCKICDYGTCKKSSYDDHLLSAKHFKRQKGNDLETNGNSDAEFMTKSSSSKYTCENCDKEFKTRSGLWKHKKICNYQMNEHFGTTDKELMMQILKDNSELKNIIFKVVESGLVNNSHNTTNNSNNTNCHNKAFNLNFFLNETCKDALNMSDFIKLIQPSFDDLENTGRKGYVEGITDLILKNLRALDQSKRPIHCSDLKRSTLYIRENNHWGKEDEDKPILTNAIKAIAHQNIKKIHAWTEKYPDCRDPESKKNNMYLKIVSNSMCGGTEEETKTNLNNIIRNIVKEVTIDKQI
jgi:hypothetical protein